MPAATALLDDHEMSAYAWLQRALDGLTVAEIGRPVASNSLSQKLNDEISLLKTRRQVCSETLQEMFNNFNL